MEKLTETPEYKACSGDMEFLKELAATMGPFLLPYGAKGKQAVQRLFEIPEHFSALVARLEGK